MDFEIISFYLFGGVVALFLIIHARKMFFQCGKCSACPLNSVCDPGQKNRFEQ